MKTTVKVLQERVRAGNRWVDVFEPGMEITDLGLVFLTVSGAGSNNWRDFEVEVQSMCCGVVLPYKMTGLQSRIRKGGRLCRMCTCAATARSRKLLRDLEREKCIAAARLGAGGTDEWAFKIMNRALRAAQRVAATC